MAYIQYPGARCGQLDVTKIPIDDYIASGGGVGVAAQGAIWVRASVEEKVYADGVDRGKVVFKFNDPCVVTLCPNDFVGGQNIGAASDVLFNLIESNMLSDSTVQYQSNEKTDNFQIDASDVADPMKRRVDAPLLNQYSMFPAAIMPCAVAVPLRSNIRPYGPYATSNFHNSCGGINVEVDKDIAPWVFGSVDLMNTAATIRLSSIETDPLVVGTTGSVTVPCLPQLSLGYSMLSEGPVLNGLSVNFGSGGISTTYSYQTFTPKFGSFSRATLDRLKLISKNRREQLKLLRNDQVLTNRIAKQRAKVDYRSSVIPTKQDGFAKQASLHRVFIGEIRDWWKDINCPDGVGESCACSSPIMYGPYNEILKINSGVRLKSSPDFGTGETAPVRHNSQRTVVGSETLSKQMLELRWDYENKAFMSMDGLLGPISVSGDGNLPQYAKYNPKCHRQSPLSPQPPFAKCTVTVTKTECNDGFSLEGSEIPSSYYNQKIEQKFENPVQNPTSCHHHLGTVHGHIIDILGRKQSIPDHMSMNLNPNQDYADDYRFLGLRGPLVLHSWGYDTWGKPIPNEADIEADTMDGVFKEENLKDRFLCEWLSKPATWPVGPVDLRFDRDRGVWVSPPQDYKVTVVRLIDDLEPLGTARAQLINIDNEAGKEYGPNLWGFEGELLNADDSLSSPYSVIVEDRIKNKYPKGTRLYAHYDTFSCKYIVFGQSSEDSTLKHGIFPSGCELPSECIEDTEDPFYHLCNNVPPQSSCYDIDSPTKDWLSFDDAKYVAIWNSETEKYDIINAQEAPILIEGKLAHDIDCSSEFIDVEVYAASNDDIALEKEPVKTLVKQCENPRGWCGKADDEVIIHRRQVDKCYKYIILHIGKQNPVSASMESGSCLLGAVEVPHEIAGCDYRYFNERIECIPGYAGGDVQHLMHGKGFGLMWHNPQSYQTKTIYGCWDGTNIEVQAFAGYNGLDEQGNSIIGQLIPASSPSSCCANQECGTGSVFAPPESGTAWASATYVNTGSSCYWMVTNAECCNSCGFPGCDECESC